MIALKEFYHIDSYFTPQGKMLVSAENWMNSHNLSLETILNSQYKMRTADYRLGIKMATEGKKKMALR